MKILILCIWAMVIGCTVEPTKPPQVIYQITPIPVVPTIAAPERPDLYIYKLTPADVVDPGKVAQYYVISLDQLITYSSQLQQIIFKYNEAAATVKTVDQIIQELPK